MNMISQLITAFLISALVVTLALWRGSLSRSGAVGAVVVGTLTFGLGGWQWGVLLGLFFVSSSLLSHFREAEKRSAAEKFDKGHRRDMGQVVANGGLGAFIALLSAFVMTDAWYPFFIGIMATVTADTWATELGTLSKRPPRLITNGSVVEVGTSGGISGLGTTVSLVGGAVVGFAAALMDSQLIFTFSLIGAVGGLAGSLFDSLLGATVQRIYYCETCRKDTERQLHKCGSPTRPMRGWPWLNNDLVNFLASIVGGGVSLGLWLMLA